ncbi:helix-turn-helix domain-containing protein [Kitasatospora purpeofusca]|uniref:helix-turn-helix domain-containing protein n=1 Tax=Kitasatospora purpeofusca TaxID=67352 RepID=UPI002252C7BF|nr:helix-turn-helix transcriptional regulator [Kitasatospora purpeofusca]MCX4756615.1 helix-turn-helix transcriptional regulator [Kitasatospora purpeofusca]WSR35588.1 helix-turn-helix transcriptional regulator [Kitasatospora purpeofusca]WSR43907.1 helix-turn-helix transcriptional regulator [Kitasatospora purpeofusca]
MPASPLSSAQEARKAIADALGAIRKDAELSGHELAQRCGWHPSKSSRIENARTTPSDADIRVWCEACGVPERAPDLIAASRSADSMYTEWKRLHGTGLRRAQEEVVPLYERTRLMRVYCSTVVPGLLQTPSYATGLLEAITEFRGIPNDVPEAVAARMARSHVLREGNHRFALLVEQGVLHHQMADSEGMAGQLGHLLAVISLPNVSLGVVPHAGRRKLWPMETFSIFDDARVQVELLSARVVITAPGEVATYARAFQELSRMAVYGAQARALITSAIAALG